MSNKIWFAMFTLALLVGEAAVGALISPAVAVLMLVITEVDPIIRTG